jgi:excisionase family DNA binding protein
MTLEEAAVLAGVSVRTLARYRRSGTLDIVRVGRRVLCSPAAIDKALERRSLHAIGLEATAEELDARPVGEWMRLLRELAAAAPSFESPDVMAAYATEVVNRHSSLPTGQFTVGHLRSVLAALSARGVSVGHAAPLLGFPDSSSAIAAFRAVRGRYGW